LITPRINFSDQEYSVGSIAARDVRVESDLLVEDKAATEQKRNEKVSAYYHDIGKVKKPQYFIENQRNGENKHVKLSPRMSSLIITTHVKDGCELDVKAKLGMQITNIIREHHGTSLVIYFYKKKRKRPWKPLLGLYMKLIFDIWVQNPKVERPALCFLEMLWKSHKDPKWYFPSKT
jgi:putative nucleotidyltransferase with HDIG domain